MKLTKELKEQIDAMSYEQMLSKNRFAPIGDEMFIGEVGKYFGARMSKLRAEGKVGMHVAASKSVGWD